MPTISIFFGIVVQMFWRDHEPAHIHVLYQGYRAAVAIETGQLIAGNLPKAALRLVQEWVELRKRDLLANWELGRCKKPFNAVPGADVDV